MAIMDRERRDREAFDGIENIEDFDPDPSRGLQKKKITKTVTAAILLFLAGSLLLYFGIRDFHVDRDKSISMIVIGSIAFIPGSYASWMLFGAWRRWPGYHYSQIPSYDE